MAEDCDGFRPNMFKPDICQTCMKAKHECQPASVSAAGTPIRAARASHSVATYSRRPTIPRRSGSNGHNTPTNDARNAPFPASAPSRAGKACSMLAMNEGVVVSAC